MLVNLLEHYIDSILEETMIESPKWSSDDWIRVKMVVDCYGHVETVENVYPVDVWENVKKKGYYMG